MALPGSIAGCALLSHSHKDIPIHSADLNSAHLVSPFSYSNKA